MYLKSDRDAQTASTETSRTPLVSIVIPYYNQQLFIAETVLSAKRQTYPNVEIIVVDDGSPVPAEPYLREIDGIQLFRTENHGCPATRNFGFARALENTSSFLTGMTSSYQERSRLTLRRWLNILTRASASVPAAAINEHGEQIRPAHICRPRRDYFLMFLESNPICSPGATMIPKKRVCCSRHV